MTDDTPTECGAAIVIDPTPRTYTVDVSRTVIAGLRDEIASLRSGNEQLHARLAEAGTTITDLRAEIERLEREVSRAQAMHAAAADQAAFYRQIDDDALCAEVERLKADGRGMGHGAADGPQVSVIKLHAAFVRLYRAANAMGLSHAQGVYVPEEVLAALDAAPESVKRAAEREDGEG